MDYTIKDLKLALLDLLDSHGALSGGAHELSGYGFSGDRQEELWRLGQELLKEREELGWT